MESAKISALSADGLTDLRSNQSRGVCKLEIKDKISITLACLAFVISAATAFYSMREEDSIHAVVQGPVSFEVDDTNKRVKVFSDQILTVMNSGTRGAGLSEVLLYFRIGGRDDGPGTCAGTFTNFSYANFTPSSIKSNEVVVVPLQFGPTGDPKSETSWLSVGFGRIKLVEPYVVCVGVTIITPTSVYRTLIPVYNGLLLGNATTVFDNKIGTPFTLVSRLKLALLPAYNRPAIELK